MTGGAQGLRKVRMVGTEGLGGSGITGPGVLRATLGPTKEEPSVLRVPPHHGPPQITAGAGGRGSTSAQERINNLFMTFNKTQTSPHWRLIKESVLSTMGRQQEGGTGDAFTLRDWGPERVRREEGEGPEHCQGGGGKRGRREGMGREPWRARDTRGKERDSQTERSKDSGKTDLENRQRDRQEDKVRRKTERGK